jgi:uncharacterized membrane protein YfcA
MDTFILSGPGDWLLLAAMLAALGGTAGFMAGLFGVGGGAVLVPGLFYIFTWLGFESEYLMHFAVGTSLAIIVPTGFASVNAHRKKKGVRFDLFKLIAPGIIVGVLIGTITADYLSGDMLKLIFACAISCFAVLMISDPSRFKFYNTVPPQPWSGLAGVFIGTISTLIGIGGATLSVPYMTMCKVPIREAIGTATALGLAISIPASIGFILIGIGEQDGLPPFTLGYVNIPALFVIIPASVLAVPAGTWAVHEIPPSVMRYVYASFLIVVAGFVLMETLVW